MSRKNGKMLDGLTPRVAFVKHQAAPPIRLDETTRYLLASHRRVEKVTARGLSIKIGKTTYTYMSEATGQLIGQKILAWFDLEDPSFITLTTLDNKNPVTVARETVVPAWRAPKEVIAQAKRENRSAHGTGSPALQRAAEGSSRRVWASVMRARWLSMLPRAPWGLKWVARRRR